MEKEKALEAKNLEFEKLLETTKAKDLEALANLKAQIEQLNSEKLALEKAKEEAEKLAKEKAEAEAKAKEEAERLAKEKAEAEKLAKEKAEEEANAKAEAERLAKEKAEAKAKEAKQELEKAFSLTHVEFRTGSAILTKESKKRLDKAVATIKKYEGYRYNIQGHTDNRGKESFNKKLSAKRAKAVKDYLVSQGVDESILSHEGFGSEQPIADNNTKEGREKNRRVVFEIIQ